MIFLGIARSCVGETGATGVGVAAALLSAVDRHHVTAATEGIRLTRSKSTFSLNMDVHARSMFNVAILSGATSFCLSLM